ncbi:gliding motility-associated C-terminal domain-containing protein [Flavitalea sp. BT771]|uniref:Ig-like domain-containing protein n=1 Tax=Flavitalea sp. BT771 TaxID=3063329 RepID=UPI0026E412DC|nr:gliding motility-associated C-terminal domain-containing protein [Flavitalea sp. BT771]MDO6430063.1 gliding motility-associated C-terminal domain-containing protein [Flavitalea sp. BT771]MDV6219798.1 gliding motility-associated C-terminal domain-containing protein [Flavitalea sp. BT771]
MTDRRGQVFKAILTAFLFPISCCFGAIRYVNINNPTPGAGTSWATAFNNLQSALAVAGTFDQIWIAQGTYKPASPAGRSATFSIPGGTTIYGGFNGTETANTQASPTLYPTILSGDIGIPGNASDNCYHVVTYNANLWIGSFHGVTIRDGQADAGSSSLAQPDNTGGGVVFLSANPGDASGTDFYNCTFTNNYAFYGGAIGSYGISALQVNYGAINCLFHDNQAVYGGAVYNTIVATDYLYVFENDIFYNNTTSSGGASVFGNAVTNGTSTEYLQMENCLFYNEAAPIFTNDFNNSAFSSIQFDYNIVWTSGPPYTSGYSGGNKPLAMYNSDIDGTFPPGSNIDADPLFVNVAGYDFHVSPCSPVIDQGSTFAQTTTDAGGNARMQGPAVDIGPYETLKGTAAVAPGVNTPIGICLNSTPSDLSGDVTGSSLLWYTSATGGTGSSIAPTPVTTATGTTQYYVTQTPAGSCESPRQEIDVTVNPLPANPTYTAPPSYCVNSQANALSANGTSLLWYTTATGGSGSPTAPTPSTTSAGTNTYYVTQTVSGCESPRMPIPVTVTPPPAAPTAAPQFYCENTTATPLTANGTGLLWYTAAAGGTGASTAPTPNTTNPGTTTWYVSQTIGCESARTPVTATVNASPEVSIDPVNDSVCAGGTVKLQANGAESYQWSPVAGLSDPSISDPVAVMKSDILYTVTGTTDHCSTSAQVALTVGTDCLGYYFPNAFSPNGDGANDLFRVKTGDVPRSFNMIVFNRYGGKVFETSDIRAGWNGTSGSNQAPAGGYVYTVVLTTSTGNVIKRQGTLILVR